MGLSYLAFGVRDLAPIAVSIAAGTLTIPVAAWLAANVRSRSRRGRRRIRGALRAAHRILADGPHRRIVPPLLARRHRDGPALPGATQSCRAVALGVAVGVAQLFKYNGWFTGAIVLMTAIAWLRLPPGGVARRRTTAAIWGWGVVAALDRRTGVLALVLVC